MLPQPPDDLLAHLATFLSNKDRKFLRLTNRQLNGSIPLSMSRVFLSASYKMIEVFRAVAAHSICKNVNEIVWDDARCETFASDDGLNEEGLDSLPFARTTKNQEDFESCREENLDRVVGEPREEAFVRARRGGMDRMSAEPLDTDAVSPDEYLSSGESFELYTRFYNEQETIFATVWI